MAHPDVTSSAGHGIVRDRFAPGSVSFVDPGRRVRVVGWLSPVGSVWVSWGWSICLSRDTRQLEKLTVGCSCHRSNTSWFRQGGVGCCESTQASSRPICSSSVSNSGILLTAIRQY